MGRRYLLITTALPGGGSGANERSMSIFRALEKLGETQVLYLRPPWASGRFSDGADHTVDMVPPGRSLRRFWMDYYYLMGEFRPEPRLREFVRTLHGRYDYSGFFCRYCVSARTMAGHLGTTVCDLDDMPLDAWSRPFGPPRAVRQRMMEWFLRSIRTVFVTKAEDATRFSHSSIRVLPCISTKRGTPAAPDDSCRILFVGPRGHRPNAQGVDHFIEQCLPAIRRRVPRAVLRIVGEGWTGQESPGVEIVGFAEDLAGEYASASLVICPIRSGHGACVKLAEAAAFGKAVVATPLAAQGYEGILFEDEHLLVAQSPESFTEACIRLLQDPDLNRRLGVSAHEAAARKLSQEAIDTVIAEAFA